MTMPIDLVLVRHGESVGNVAIKKSRKGDHSGYTTDLLELHSSKWRLTDLGREQAAKAGLWLRANISPTFDRYFVSEYWRAKETAALLGFPNANWLVEFYLRERDWGVFDNMAEDERLVKYPDWKKKRKQDGFFWAPPNGESVADVCLRNERILNTLHRECSDKRVVIVLHGETMWAFRVRLERMSQKRYHELDESKDPKDQIYNCQILHYTRRNPGTNELAPYLNWFRSICPSDLRLSRNSWETIVRPKYSNEDLLAEVEKTPRLID